jgi:hypothetical protein
VNTEQNKAWAQRKTNRGYRAKQSGTQSKTEIQVLTRVLGTIFCEYEEP